MSALSATDAAPAIKSGVKLIDVRTAAQHASDGLPGSISLPLDRIEGGEVPSGVRPEETLLVVCEFGGFSELAVAYLRAAGYANAHTVRGGLRALRELPSDP